MADYQCIDCKKMFSEEQLEKIILEDGKGAVYRCGCVDKLLEKPVSRFYRAKAIMYTPSKEDYFENYYSCHFCNQGKLTGDPNPGFNCTNNRCLSNVIDVSRPCPVCETGRIFPVNRERTAEYVEIFRNTLEKTLLSCSNYSCSFNQLAEKADAVFREHRSDEFRHPDRPLHGAIPEEDYPAEIVTLLRQSRDETIHLLQLHVLYGKDHDIRYRTHEVYHAFWWLYFFVHSGHFFLPGEQPPAPGDLEELSYFEDIATIWSEDRKQTENGMNCLIESGFADRHPELVLIPVMTFMERNIEKLRRTYVELILANHLGRIASSNPVIRKVLLSYLESPEKGMRLFSATALGREGNGFAAARLADLIINTDFKYEIEQQEALELLFKIKSPESIASLYRVYSTSNYYRTRYGWDIMSFLYRTGLKKSELRDVIIEQSIAALVKGVTGQDFATTDIHKILLLLCNAYSLVDIYDESDEIVWRSKTGSDPQWEETDPGYRPDTRSLQPLESLLLAVTRNRGDSESIRRAKALLNVIPVFSSEEKKDFSS
ncbi:MAG: hypothetical protein ACFFD4_36655 [Candidatus Odinarchaeota archaeon]